MGCQSTLNVKLTDDDESGNTSEGRSGPVNREQGGRKKRNPLCSK